MGEFLGADTEQLRGWGERTQQCAQQAASVLEQATGAAATVSWFGPDADDVHQELREAVQRARDVTDRLRTCGEDAQDEAEDQDRTSEDGGAAGGPSIPPVTQDLSAATRQELDELLARAVDDRGWQEVDGNRGDLDALEERLSELTPEERRAYLASLSDEQLAALDDALMADGTGSFDWGGNTEASRRRLLDELLRDAAPEDVERLADAFPLLRPDQRGGGDAAQGTFDVEPDGTFTPTGPVVPEDASWRDVDQGAYGDCVSMATLGMVMRQDPSWASEHVVDNGNGTVTVTLYDENGDPEPITMPKELPTRDGVPVGASRDVLAGDPQGATWPAYVERALAMQMGGSYADIESHGSPEVGPRLTGMTVETHPPTDPDTVFEAARDGEPIIVGTAIGTPQGTPPDGWVGGHGFWVDGVSTNEAGEEVIVLRNPHGAGSPTVEMTREEYSRYTSSAEIHHD